MMSLLVQRPLGVHRMNTVLLSYVCPDIHLNLENVLTTTVFGDTRFRGKQHYHDEASVLCPPQGLRYPSQ